MLCGKLCNRLSLNRLKWFSNCADTIESCLRYLSDATATEDETLSWKEYWLWKFAAWDNTPSVYLCKELLKNDARLDPTKSIFVTATYHRAARFGNNRLLKLLLENGYISRDNVDARDELGWTPTHNAAWHNEADCVRTLLNHGSNPNISSKEGTPLEIAREYESIDVIRLFRKRRRAELRMVYKLIFRT